MLSHVEVKGTEILPQMVKNKKMDGHGNDLFEGSLLSHQKKSKLSRYMPWRHMGGKEV
jgi:hypothetical protein